MRVLRKVLMQQAGSKAEDKIPGHTQDQKGALKSSARAVIREPQ